MHRSLKRSMWIVTLLRYFTFALEERLSSQREAKPVSVAPDAKVFHKEVKVRSHRLAQAGRLIFFHRIGHRL
jgi:hypothetical protein